MNEFKKTLSALIGALFGYPLLEKYICSDNPGLGKFLQKLRAGWPVLLVRRDGFLTLMLPQEDYKALEAGEIDVKDYVSIARWSYGYYWGSDKPLLDSIYWQPLEQHAGITNTFRISRYLQILRCRADEEALELDMPTEARCAACSLDETTCPHSLCQVSNLEDEVYELDARGKVFLEIKKRLKAQGLYVCVLDAHDIDGVPSQVHISPLNIEHRWVTARISQTVLNSLLYDHSDENWQSKALTLTELVVQRAPGSKDCITLNSALDLGEQCLQFWNTEPSTRDVANTSNYKGRRHFPRRGGWVIPGLKK